MIFKIELALLMDVNQFFTWGPMHFFLTYFFIIVEGSENGLK